MSNQMIQAQQQENLTELRLLRVAIADSREKSIGFDLENPLIIKVDEYAKLFNVDRKNIHRMLKTACDALWERCFVEIDQKRPSNIRKTRYLTSLGYNEGEIHLVFNPDMREHIWRLSKDFTSVDILSYSRLKSAYSIRLYELLSQWRRTGFCKQNFDGLRFALNVSPNRYLKDFNIKVLRPALDEINVHSDLIIELEFEKEGVKILNYIFKIREKAKMAVLGKNPRENSIMSYRQYCERFKLETESLDSAMGRLTECYERDVKRKASFLYIGNDIH